MNTRTVVSVHLFRERFDVLLAVLAPLIMMAESGYANAWVFAGGHLGSDFPSLMAWGRGIFLEALIFACYKLVRVFSLKKKYVIAVVPFLVGSVGMIVSAGCNLGWMSQSPEMKSAFAAVAANLPSWMGQIFHVGLGLLFPIGVGVFALFDVSHLIDELLKSAHLDNKAVMVIRSELHRTAFLKHQKRQIKAAAPQYEEICQADVESMVDRARKGDFSFGANELTESPLSPQTPSSVTRISQAVPSRALPAPGAPVTPVAPIASQPAYINGQYTTNVAPTGNTQTIHVPPAPAPVPVKKKGVLNWMAGN